MMETSRHKTSNEIARSAIVLAGFSFLALTLNLFWNLKMAELFGASGELDAFWVALAIPKAIADSFHLGLLVLLFMVIFGLEETSSDEERRRLASSVLNLVVLGTLVFIVLIQWNAPSLVRMLGPGLDALQTDSAVDMLRMLSVMLVFTVLAGALAGVVNAHRNFLPYALARSVGLALQLSALLLLTRWLQLEAAVWATLVGAVGMFVVCIPFLRRTGFRYVGTIRFGSPEARRVLGVFATLAAVSFLAFINQSSDRFFASFQSPGSISALEFAWRFEIPITQIAGYSVALPAFALFAVYASKNQRTLYRETVAVTVRMMSWLLIPLIGYLVVLRGPLTALWFERGVFSTESSALVSSLLPFLSVVFFLRALSVVMVFGLLCLGKTRVLILVMAAEVGVNTLGNALLVDVLGVRGIALATAAAMVVSNSFLWTVFVREMGEFSPRHFLARVYRTAAVNIGAVGLLAVVGTWASRWNLEAEPLYLFSFLAVAGLVYLVVYLVLCQWAGLIEIRKKKGRGVTWSFESSKWSSNEETAQSLS